MNIVDENSLDDLRAGSDEPSIDERLDERELNDLIADEINNLPEKFRSVVMLFHIQEMSYEEISSVLNAPIGTVKTNLFRARNLLKRKILGRMKGEMKVA